MAELDDTVDLLCWEQSATDNRTRAAVQAAIEAVLDEPVGEALAEGGAVSLPGISVIASPNPIDATHEDLKIKRADMLVAPRSRYLAGPSRSRSSCSSRTPPCAVFMPLFGERSAAETRKILVLVNGSVHDRVGVEMGRRLADDDADVTVVMLERDLGEGTIDAGERELDRIFHDANATDSAVERRVIVDSQTVRGVLRALQDHDLVLVGRAMKDHVRSLREQPAARRSP